LSAAKPRLNTQRPLRGPWTQSLRVRIVTAGNQVLRVASRAYVPGPQLADAIAFAHKMAGSGMACTLGYFNAETDAAPAIVAQNRAASDAMAGDGLAGYLSIKVPPLGYDKAALSAIAERARQHTQLLHLDSHGPDTATPTFAALLALLAEHPRLGVTLPGRWLRSPGDADWAVAHGVRVRVVKGQWACAVRPDLDPRAGFLAVVDRLAGRASEVAVATHDAALAREALGRLQRAGTRCELELLCGLPRRDVLAVARDLTVPVRMYIPFGEAWLPYALGQVARQPRMLWWATRDTIQALFDR
jgi:proline dehydrogenase